MRVEWRGMAEEIHCEAVVLHRTVGRQGEKKVILWTDQLGKISVLAKGAAKSSKWSGRFEPLNHLELKILRTRRGYQVIRAEVLDSYLNREHPEVFYQRSIPFLRLFLTSLVSDIPLPNTFSLFLAVLRILGECQHPETVYAFFSAAMLAELGGPRIFVAGGLQEACGKKAEEKVKRQIVEGWKLSLHIMEPNLSFRR